MESWEAAAEQEQLHGVLWNVLDGSEQPLHSCLIPQQDFWDTPALLIPRILSSEEETIPESVGAVREPSAGAEPPARCPLAPEQLLGIPNVFIVHSCE